MPSTYSILAQLPDDQLLAEVTRLAASERRATADLVASLVVLDERRLYLREGYPSLFAYCTGALGLSEAGAYLRIEAARTVRRLPLLLERLATGAITLTGVKLLAPHLTADNHRAVLDSARGKSTRAIEQLVAQLHPRPDVPAVVRKLPARQVAGDAAGASLPSAPARLAPPATAAAHHAPTVAVPAAGAAALHLAPPAGASTAVRPPRAVVVPLAPERYKVQMTIGAETHERLCRARALLCDTIPDGDPAAIFDRALVLLLEQLERQKWGARKARRGTAGDAAPPAAADAEGRTGSGSEPSASPAADAELVLKRVPPEDPEADRARLRKVAKAPSRRIPAAVRRAVWLRAHGQCTYVSPSSHVRCGATSRLEFHHVVPYADGGPPTVEGVRLLCRAHHARETERWFGERPVPGGPP